MMSGVGAAVGLLLGGWLTGLEPTMFGTVVEGWRLTFLINVPIGLAGAFAARCCSSRASRTRRQLDIPGAITATAGLLSLVFGITRGRRPDLRLGRHAGPSLALASGVLLLLCVRARSSAAVAQPLLPGASSRTGTGWRRTP